jgi:glycosyltransferase involved in cell wall biosynthesis
MTDFTMTFYDNYKKKQPDFKVLQVLLISPFHGGSHAAWATGLQRNSSHQVKLLTLPARFWKWRMHGGSVTLARRFASEGVIPDVILATDMVDLSTFLALTRPHTGRLPVALYMHENQLTYPLPEDGTTGPMRRQKGERDLHYAFVNYASMLSADRIYFNSNYHLDEFFGALPGYLRRFPEFRELETVPILKQRSTVLPVGIDTEFLLAGSGPDRRRERPLILWNQRWEFDKRPQLFFQTLRQSVDSGREFDVAICGENFRRRPIEFESAKEDLADRVVHFGFTQAKEYRDWLWQSNVVVSTAVHEFFGLSILEAIFCHTMPILPNSLSYPQLIPQPFHDLCLYESQKELLQKLNWAIDNPERAREIAATLAESASRFGWAELANQYDHALYRLWQEQHIQSTPESCI